MHVPILCRRGAGDPRAPTPDRYRSARRQQTTALDPSRPGGCGLLLSRIWRDWRSALAIVKPEKVIGWYRQGFLQFWIRKVRRGNPGRPRVSRELRDLGSVAHEPATATKNQTECPFGDGCFNNCIVHYDENWLSPSHEGCLRHRLGNPKQRCRLQLRACIEGLGWAILGADHLVTLNCIVHDNLRIGQRQWSLANRGNFHPTLKISLSTHGTERRPKTLWFQYPFGLHVWRFAYSDGSRRTDVHNLAEACAAGFSMGFPLASFVFENPSRSLSPRDGLGSFAKPATSTATPANRARRPKPTPAS
jgi:hypothetical protein